MHLRIDDVQQIRAPLSVRPNRAMDARPSPYYALLASVSLGRSQVHPMEGNVRDGTMRVKRVIMHDLLGRAGASAHERTSVIRRTPPELFRWPKAYLTPG